MGTRNYYTEDAKAIYSIEPDCVDDIKSDEVFEGWSEDNIQDHINEGFPDVVDSTKEYILECIEKKLKGMYGIDIDNGEREDYNRNFPGLSFAEINIADARSDKDVSIALVVRSGYYEGVNFDYTIEKYQWGCLDDELELNTQLQRKLEKVLTIVENVYNENTQKIN